MIPLVHGWLRIFLRLFLNLKNDILADILDLLLIFILKIYIYLRSWQLNGCYKKFDPQAREIKERQDLSHKLLLTSNQGFVCKLFLNSKYFLMFYNILG